MKISKLIISSGLSMLALSAAWSANARAEDANAAQDSEIVVVNGKKVVAVGKTGQPLRLIPQSITVMTRDRLDQQGLMTLDDVMLQTTGVTREQLWLNNNYSVRGIKIENIRYDGGSAGSAEDRSNNADMAQYDNVELLRGADGLFGAGEAGGVINLVSKRPKSEREISGTFTIGRWNNYRAEIDATNALNQDKTIQGRIVGVFQDQDYFYKPTHNQRGMIYGALNFDFTPQTSLFTGISYQRDKTDAFDASLPRYEDGADINLPRSATMGADWGWMDRKNSAIFAVLKHQINDDWKARFNLRYNVGNDGINGAEMEGAVDYDTLSSQWWRYQDATKFKELTFDINLQGKFELFGRTHDVIWGIDGSDNQNDYKQNWIYYADGNAINRIAPPEWSYPPTSWQTNSTTKNTKAATYGSVRLHPIDKLAVILGGRYNFKNDMTIDDHLTGIKNDYKEDNKFIPYYGITYDVLPATTIYASYAEIYKSQANYLETISGPALSPMTGSNLELGVKSQITPNIMTSIALFKIEKEKEAVYLSWNSLGGSNSYCCYVGTGSKKSQGVDFEINGQINPNWTLNFGYTYNKNEDKQNTDKPFDTYTPKHLAKIWTNYKLNQLVKGLEIGGGVTAQSENYVNGWVQAFNPVTKEFDGAWTQIQINQPKYAIWSMRLAYNINPNWNIALNMNNIFDKKYYSTIGYPGYGNFYGEPRNYMLTLRAKY